MSRALLHGSFVELRGSRWSVRPVGRHFELHLSDIPFAPSGYSYTEGFWCAVFSAILAGCISIMLCPYAIYVTFYNPEDNKSVRVQGRHFMVSGEQRCPRYVLDCHDHSILTLGSLPHTAPQLSELALFIFIAFEALVIYRIEGWEYFDTIYFCIVSAITVGFGDFAPTRTASM